MSGLVLPLVLLVVVPAGPVGDEPLRITSVDASGYPEVVIDFVLPERFVALDITPAMIDVDGSQVATVAPVDPAEVAVSLVIDDRPSVLTDAVGVAQGAAVELVRNLGAGTRIALGTPSGLQTAFTADPDASIARISGITAGAPAVTPLPRLILDGATALVADGVTDRHLVVIVGAPLAATEAELNELADLVSLNGITLHVVSSAGPPDQALVQIAEQTSGTVPATGTSLAGVDEVTAAIANRYRVTATVNSPGQHDVGLTVDGTRFAAVVGVAAPAPPAAPTTAGPVPTTVAAAPPETTTVGAAPPETTTVGGAAPPETTTVGGAAPPETTTVGAAGPVRTTVAGGEGRVTIGTSERGTLIGIMIAIALAVAAVGLAAAWFVSRRRTTISGMTGPISGRPVPLAPLVPEPEAETDAGPPAEPELEPGRELVPEHHGESGPTAQVEQHHERPALPLPRPAGPPRGHLPAAGRAWRGGRPDPAEAVWLVAGSLRFCPESGETWAGNRLVHLRPAERGILELLMTRGNRGVTQQELIDAGHLQGLGRDLAPTLFALERKTGITGRRQMLRRERALLYFFDNEVDVGPGPRVSTRR